MHAISDLCSVFIAPLFPLVVAAFVPIKNRYPVVYRTVAALMALAGIINAVNCGWHGHVWEYGSAIKFVFDRYSYLFTILVNGAWFLTMVYSTSYVRHGLQDKMLRFHFLMAIAVASSIACGLSGNMVTAFLFYFISIIPIAPLINMTGGIEAFKATKFYLKSTLLPPLLLALPVAVYFFPMKATFGTWSVTSLGIGLIPASLIMAALILGLSKNCVAPFHLWLPRSSLAPIPVTALLHSVAVIQSGLVILLRIADNAYGSALLIDLNDHFVETGWMTYLFGFTAVYTAWKALKSTDLKRRFSFSTVGQLSYMLTAMLLGTKQALTGAVLHMITHAISKLNLLFAAGTFTTVIGTSEAPVVAKWIPHHRWLGYACVLSGLSITGFPFLAGYYSKDLMLIEEIHRHHYAAAVFLVLGSMINLAYIMPIIRATVKGKKDPSIESGYIPMTMRAAIVAGAIASILVSKYIYVITRVVTD